MTLKAAFFYSWVSWIVWEPVVMASVNHVETKLALIRAGELSAQAERAYPLVESKIRRWLENQSGVSLSVEPRSPGVLKGELKAVLVESSLSRLTEQAWSAKVRGANELSEMGEAIREAREKGVSGRVLQSALLAEAYLVWEQGKRSLARQKMKTAIDLHPAGEVVLPSLWQADPDSVRDATVFEEEIRTLQRRRNQSCELVIEVSPASVDIALNGFLIQNRRRFLMPPRTGVEVSFPADPSQRKRVVCEHVGVTKIRWEVDEASVKFQAPLKALQALRGAAQSLCLIEPREDHFRVFLFTPGVGVDEVPMSTPVRYARLLENPSAPLPISTDAFLNLIERHRSLEVASLSLVEPPDGAPTIREKTEAPERWYNDWKVWGVVGAAAVIALVAYVGSQERSVGTQNGMLRVKLD